MKKLYKSQNDKKICGVCGGIAEYFGIDSTIVRLIWAALIIFWGTGVLAYILAAFILPDRPVVNKDDSIDVDVEVKEEQ